MLLISDKNLFLLPTNQGLDSRLGVLSEVVKPRFVAFAPPPDHDVCDVVETIATKVIKHLSKKAYL